MQQTYQNITNLMDYWSADLQTNTQTALQHIQAGNLDSTIGCLLRNRETLKILDALHESLFTIHRRGYPPCPFNQFHFYQRIIL